MADYRLYSLDGEGRINLADWIEADSDEQAIARARQLKLGARKCEIWRKNQLVATIDPQLAVPLPPRGNETST